MKKIIVFLGVAVMCLLLMGCGTTQQEKNTKTSKKINFADVGWDSIKLNNALAGLVAKEVFGYTWQETPGSTPISHEALIKGDLDLNMEEWTNNIATYEPDLKAGKFQEVGVNFEDNAQGFYIPSYVAEKYPQLKTVRDLAKYPELFPDPEGGNKGIIYGGVTGWEITKIMEKKVAAYGLNTKYNYFASGSDAILAAAMTSAWDKKKPIVAYYWEPTWLLGKYKFVLLADEPYDKAKFSEGYGACPSVRVTIVASNNFAKNNPEYCAFLGKFKMSSKIISETLAYMNDEKADYNTAAKWLLTKAHPELIDAWLTPKQAEKLKKALR